MKNKNLQIKLIPEIEKQFKIKVADIKTPPQGMDSEVFFIMDSNGKEYAIKHGKNAANDILSYKLLEENKVNIPVPKLFGNFTFENEMVVILEKINFSLLESIPVNEMYRYIPSMVENLKKIHQVKSDKVGFLNEANKKSNWKELMLSKFTGVSLDWNAIAQRKGLDTKLILRLAENIIKKIEETEFIDKTYSFLHTDFNQRNLFINPNSDEITGIIDWSEAMFGDPIYDFARVRMYIWHFNLGDTVLENYYRLISFSPEQKNLEELYWLSRVIEYLAYYSEKLNKFNTGRIKLHQDFLREYKWVN